MSPLWLSLSVAEGIVAVVFYHLLRAPTLAGGKLRDAIDGFALYLKTAEQPRLAVHGLGGVRIEQAAPTRAGGCGNGGSRLDEHDPASVPPSPDARLGSCQAGERRARSED